MNTSDDTEEIRNLSLKVCQFKFCHIKGKPDREIKKKTLSISFCILEYCIQMLSCGVVC